MNECVSEESGGRYFYLKVYPSRMSDVVLCIFNPSTEKAEVGESLESEASPIFIVSSRIAKAM